MKTRPFISAAMIIALVASGLWLFEHPRRSRVQVPASARTIAEPPPAATPIPTTPTAPTARPLPSAEPEPTLDEHADPIVARTKLANALRKQGKFAEAEARYEEVLEISTKTLGAGDPKTLDARVNLANDLDDEGKYTEAEDLYETAVVFAEKELGPSHPKTLGIRMGLANTLEFAGDYERAIQEYLRLTKLAPGSPLGYNGAAWLYATCPRASLRNGAKAAGLAGRACGLSGWTDWRFIDTLAAAEAESGKFDAAAQHSRQALDLATSAKADAGTLAQLRAHLALFQKGQPYHQPAAGQ